MDGDLVADAERADPCRGAREDDVAREQGHGLGDVDDEVLDRAQHVARAPELALLAVHRALEREVGRVEIRLDPGAERAGAVEALGAGPLLLAALGVAGGDVVGTGVAEDHVLGAFAGHLAAHAADHDGEFRLVRQLLGEGGVRDRVAGAAHGGGGLEEGDRVLGDLVAHLLGVLRVVAADGHDLAGQRGRQQADLVQGDLGAGQLELGERDALDDVEDEPVRVLALDGSEGHIAVDGESGDAHGWRVPLCWSGSWVRPAVPRV
ncbi:putative 2-keto-4-pentenoate hydratase/2-oxohepta-3-ene-1,7-dioic acid hydratase [Streptomyces sp. Tu6071]|nr:putative 2-keto-4-pentenoate hydratase/2-oxohepta-3-ene-1,7-dioic acid hydratase [Streptomyces sp. Tu6071]